LLLPPNTCNLTLALLWLFGLAFEWQSIGRIQIFGFWFNDLRTNGQREEGMFGFIRSRGRPKQKPPETTLNKSTFCSSIRNCLAIVIAIILIAFYSRETTIRNVFSGNNNALIFSAQNREVMAQKMKKARQIEASTIFYGDLAATGMNDLHNSI
jgi:hypothetical protein